MFRSWRQSVRELGERVERLEGELGRLNMENADLKSQLKERDARIAKLESVLEESRRAGKRQAAPFSKDKPKRDPKKPGRKPGSKYGRQAVRAIPVPDKTFEAPCPEQCPCGGKVGAEGSIDLYQVDIPPIQPETWKFVVGHGHCQECGRRVRGQHPLLISKAFEVGTVHFGPRLLAFAAFQKMICGVSYDKIRLGFEQMLGFPVARSLTAHTHHAPESSGSQCYNCHMPHTTWGLLGAMRAHRIDSPSVAVSVSTGRPNACNLCHLDTSLGDASDRLTAWYGQPAVALTVEERDIAASILWLIKGNGLQRAILAWHMSWKPALAASGDTWQAAYLSQVLNDPYPAVRHAAGRSLHTEPFGPNIRVSAVA